MPSWGIQGRAQLRHQFATSNLNPKQYCWLLLYLGHAKSRKIPTSESFDAPQCWDMLVCIITGMLPSAVAISHRAVVCNGERLFAPRARPSHGGCE